MQTEYKLSVTIEEILEGVNQVVKDFYFKSDLAFMPSVARYLAPAFSQTGIESSKVPSISKIAPFITL